MPKTKRLLDTFLLAACIPAFAPVIAVIVAREVAVSFAELRRGDRSGLWGSR